MVAVVTKATATLAGVVATVAAVDLEAVKVHAAVAVVAAEVVVGPAFKGELLLGVKAKHPFEERWAEVFGADYVENGAGTGLVHTAPGHGRDDYKLGSAHGLEAYAPVGDDGRYTGELGDGGGAGPAQVAGRDEEVVPEVLGGDLLIFCF